MTHEEFLDKLKTTHKPVEGITVLLSTDGEVLYAHIFQKIPIKSIKSDEINICEAHIDRIEDYRQHNFFELLTRPKVNDQVCAYIERKDL